MNNGTNARQLPLITISVGIEDQSVVDRRRPGRTAMAQPALIPLLRYAPPSPLSFNSEEELDEPALERLPPVSVRPRTRRDGLGAIIGITSALLISVPIWAAIGVTVIWLLS